MTPKEKQDKFNEVIETLVEVYKDDALNEAIDMIFDIIFQDFPEFHQSHLGTFAEFKHIDEFNEPPLLDDAINRSSCGWSTCDIQEAIRRAKEYENKSK